MGVLVAKKTSLAIFKCKNNLQDVIRLKKNILSVNQLFFVICKVITRMDIWAK